MSSVGPEMISGVRASSMRIEVHLVDDREIERPLDHLVAAVFHVVAKIVEAKLVVGRVGDVANYKPPPLLVGEVGDDHSDAHSEEPVDLAHPVGVAPGKIVVHRDDVDALALEGVEIDCKCRDERLSFARLHLGDLAAMESDAADQLNIVMALPEGSDRRLADGRKGLGKEVVELLTICEALTEQVRLTTQFLVGKRAELFGSNPLIASTYLPRPRT